MQYNLSTLGRIMGWIYLILGLICFPLGVIAIMWDPGAEVSWGLIFWIWGIMLIGFSAGESHK
jgi:hypothetical protein